MRPPGGTHTDSQPFPGSRSNRDPEGGIRHTLVILRDGYTMQERRFPLSARLHGYPATIVFAILLVCAVHGPVPAYSQDQNAAESEPFLPLGAWFEGNPELLGLSETAAFRDYLDRAFADIAGIGLNCITVPNIPPHHQEMLLEVAAAHGLKVILEIGVARDMVGGQAVDADEYRKVAEGIASAHGYSHVLERYQLRDQPPPEMMSAWLAMQAALAQADPRHPSFSCFNNPDALRMAREADALSEAVFNLYPLGVEQAFGDFGSFDEQLRVFLDAAGPLPTWIVLQAFANDGRWRYPESVELRYMSYLALARGVEGFFFFVYQTMPLHPDGIQGMVDTELVPRPIFAEVKRLATRLGRMSETIRHLSPVPPFALVPENVDAGFFRHSDGAWCVAIVNRDLERSRYIPIRLADWVRPKPNRVRDEALGGPSSFRWNVGPPSTRILLGPGEGTILRFWREPETR